jgi:chromosomal replication initiator protein
VIETLPRVQTNPFGWPESVRFARTPATSPELVAFVAEWLGCTPAELTGASRNTDLVRGRWAIMIAISEQRGWAMQRIGIALGGRDHTTVMNGLARGRELAARDPNFARLVAAVAERARV